MLRRDQVPPRLMSMFRNMKLRKDLPLDYTDHLGNEAQDLFDAHVVTSEINIQPPGKPTISWHYVALDIDMPVMAVPSSKPGHFHLYIDHPVKWDDYVELMKAMAKCGIVEEGYVRASIKRKATYLRLPWIQKGHERVSAAVSTPEAVEEFLAQEDEPVLEEEQWQPGQPIF